MKRKTKKKVKKFGLYFGIFAVVVLLFLVFYYGVQQTSIWNYQGVPAQVSVVINCLNCPKDFAGGINGYKQIVWVKTVDTHEERWEQVQAWKNKWENLDDAGYGFYPMVYYDRPNSCIKPHKDMNGVLSCPYADGHEWELKEDICCPYVPEPEPELITVYRLCIDKDECKEMQIFEADRIADDSDTLSECEAHIIVPHEPEPEPSFFDLYVGIILFIIGIFILLFIILWRRLG